MQLLYEPPNYQKKLLKALLNGQRLYDRIIPIPSNCVKSLVFFRYICSNCISKIRRNYIIGLLSSLASNLINSVHVIAVV